MTIVDDTVCEASVKVNHVHYNWNTPQPKEVSYTLEEIMSKEYFTINLVNDSGKMIQVI
jgi:REP element-mobilizing transposase RayT